MNSRDFCELAARLLRCPTAPYYEHAVRDEVERICAEHSLGFEQDLFGNVLVRLRTVSNRRALVLAAHMDHPGFEMMRQVGDGRWLARFCDGVPDDYFRPGLRVRLMPGAVPAKLGRRKDKQKRIYEIETARSSAAAPRFGMWDLMDFAVRNERIYSRACDDLVGVASVLATLIELKRSRARVDVIGVLSRAEEVGFHGALALAAGERPGKGGQVKGGGRLPANSLVISLETSRELPGVKMGQGVILRVGDRVSVFDAEAGRFLAEVAAELKAKGKGFAFQRGLMSGGTCEATVYQELGFQSTGVCVALGNYHNCGAGNRIREEYVSLADACGMVELLVSAAEQMPNYEGLVEKLPKRLRKMLREAQPKLRRTASGQGTG